MIRLVGILIGLGFSFIVLLAFGSGVLTVIDQGYLKEETAEHAFHQEAHGPDGGFQFEGVLGTWDYAQLQRGYQVYREVCSACHSLDFVAIRDLQQLGYTEDQVKAEAATITVAGIDPNTGEATTRPALPTDYFPAPYANDVMAAAANNNAIPPDLSLMAKAREGGPSYIYSLLTGYAPPSEELLEEFPDSAPGAGLHHNPYFANLNLAMAPPLTTDGQVTYAEGNPEPTIEQMSADVSAFLMWTAEPQLVKRRQTGWAVLGFLLFATILAWFAKKQVWAAVKPRKD
ncbi:cytochrome c1 [Aurantiacibacter gilvus]|uniref:Cytochrome c1 n=1 Tax=Aurantiacibacter gilvus TaxID=3139141 RepID=A0ABU9IH32_9SPHN